MNPKAQGAIEYLLIIGAAVIIVVIVIMLMMSLSDTGTTNVQGAGLESIYSDLKIQRDKAIGSGLTMNGVFYAANDPFIENVVGLFSFDNGLNNSVYPNDPGVCSNEPLFDYSCPEVKVHFYVNGEWIKTSSPGNNMFDNSTYYVAIGGNPSKNFGEYKEFFYGFIDEVVIIDRPFSGEEIQKLYGGS